MPLDTSQRISAHNFSSMFEKMCNYIAVAKTGDLRETIRGLVTLCLFELPDDHLDGAQAFCVTIETLFGLSIPEDQIEAALNELEKDNRITRPGNTNYRLQPTEMAALQQNIGGARSLEERVKSTWFEHIKTHYPALPTDGAWKVLRSYLQRTFRRHGIQAAALLDPTVVTPSEHEASLTAILNQAIDEQCFREKNLQECAKKAVSEFMASLGADPDRIKYITQLADAAFNFYTMEIPADLSKQLRQQLHELTLFLDTNFLFGILNLHNNTQVQVSHDLLRAISEHKLPFKLRYHEATYKEMQNTISHYGGILRSRAWTQSLSRAASSSRNLSGIEQKFHERNAQNLVDVNEFLRPYEHFDILLGKKDIKIYHPHEDRTEAQGVLFGDYHAFLENTGRGDKSYETVMHDAKVLEEARNLRTTAASSLEARSLFISCDYFLFRYDWETSRKNDHRACVLMPNMFWQILRPFIPTDQDFEKAFAETFALPEFRALGSGGSKACSKMLQILASYKDVPEETAMKMLANDLLLEQLLSEQNEVKFADQVQAAFVEENRNLIEEMATKEQELKQHKLRADEENLQRQKEYVAHEKKISELQKKIESDEQKFIAANLAIEEHEKTALDAVERARRAEESSAEAQKAADEARRIAEQDSVAKLKAQKQAHIMRVIAGFAIGGVFVFGFLFASHYLPWKWLVTHKNAIPLQIGFSAIIVLASSGLFVNSWRTWCWGVGVISFAVTLLALMGT